MDVLCEGGGSGFSGRYTFVYVRKTMRAASTMLEPECAPYNAS